jgi:hypothetical protein
MLNSKIHMFCTPAIQKGKVMSIIKKVRRKRLKSGCIGICCSLVIFFSIYPLWLPYSALIAIGVAFPLFFVISNYFMRTKHIMIWFRKFNENDKYRFKFSNVLNIACRDVCIPVTIQDSRYKRSYTGILSKWLWMYILFGGSIVALWMILSFILMYILIIILFPSSSHVSESVLMSVMIFGFIVPGLIVIYIGYAFRESLDLRGFYSLDIDTGIDRASRILSKIVRRLFVFHGILVMKCPDEVWKQIVEFVLGTSNAVLIDVSEPTESLLWELEASLKNKPKNSIIIACSIKKNEPEQLPREVQEAMMRITGQSDLAGLKVFYYPAEKPSFLFGKARSYNSTAKRFREEVGSIFLTP